MNTFQKISVVFLLFMLTACQTDDQLKNFNTAVDSKTGFILNSPHRVFFIKWDDETSGSIGGITWNSTGPNTASAGIFISKISATCPAGFTRVSPFEVNWTMKCNNGKSARGKLVHLEFGEDVIGIGKDSSGKDVEFTIGDKL